MILTFSDSEEEILNKIKSVLVCENTVEFMDNVNIQKLRFASSIAFAAPLPSSAGEVIW